MSAESPPPCRAELQAGGKKQPPPVTENPPPKTNTHPDQEHSAGDETPRESAPVDTLLICFLRLARELGVPISEADLHAACPIPESGMNINVFSMAARRFGYAVRRITFDDEAALELPTPFILLGTREAGALLAVCIQHEMDHLEGKLFVDYLSEIKRQRTRKKLEKARKQSAVEKPGPQRAPAI